MQYFIVSIFLAVVLSVTGVAAEVKATDRSAVSVNVDGVTYQCSAGTSTGGSVLVSGSYKNLTTNELCPQAIRAQVGASGMTGLTVSYLSPCSGSTTMTCTAGVCTGDQNTITVMGSDLYYFLNLNGLGARFQLQ